MAPRCHIFTHGKILLINQQSFTMWEALRTILSTQYVQKFRAASGGECGGQGGRYALFLRMGKIFYRINGLRSSRYPCAQSYPHFLCRTSAWRQLIAVN
jgi:hypothetical protein